MEQRRMANQTASLFNVTKLEDYKDESESNYITSQLKKPHVSSVIPSADIQQQETMTYKNTKNSEIDEIHSTKSQGGIGN